MESQPHNPEFRNNPENFHPCTFHFKLEIVFVKHFSPYNLPIHKDFTSFQWPQFAKGNNLEKKIFFLLNFTVQVIYSLSSISY